MLRPSAPPLNDLIQLQAIKHHNQAIPATEMKPNYSDGSPNPYASSPVPAYNSYSPSPPPPPQPAPMPYMNMYQKQHYQHQHQQQPLLDGYGYAVPVVPLEADGRGNGANCCLALCRCHLKNVGMLCIAFVEFCISALLLSAGLWCLVETANFCPFYSALWTASLCVVASLVGMVAATVMDHSTHWHVANLVLSLVSAVLAIAGAMVAQRNWRLVGLYKGIDQPILRRDSFFCLLGEYDQSRTKHAMTQHEPYFNKCLFQVKLGIAINTAQLMFTILLAILFLLTAVFCVRKIIIAAKKR